MANISLFGASIDWTRLKSFKYTGTEQSEILNENSVGIREVIVRSTKDKYKMSLQALTQAQYDAIVKTLDSYKDNTYYQINITDNQYGKAFREHINYDIGGNVKFFISSYSVNKTATLYNIDIDLYEESGKGIYVDKSGTQHTIVYRVVIGTPTPKTFTTQNYLLTPSGISQEVNPADSTSVLGGLQCKLINDDYVVSQWLHANLETISSTLSNTVCQVYVDVDSSPILLYTGFLRSVKPDAYETMYTLEIVDINEKGKEQSLVQKDNGNGTYSDYYFKKSVSNFSNAPTGFTKYAIYTDPTTKEEKKITSTSQIPSDAVTSGWWDNTVYVIEFTGHPLDLAKNILNDIGLGSFLPDVQITAMKARIDNTVLNNLVYRFYEPIERTLEFIQTNCFLVSSCYCAPNTDGTLVLYTQQPFTAQDIPGISVIGNNDIVKITNRGIDFSNVVNNLEIHSKYDSIKKAYYRADRYVNPDSIKRYKSLLPKTPRIIQLMGSVKDKWNDTDCELLSNIIQTNVLKNYAENAQTIGISVFYSSGKDVKLGGYVSLSSDDIINWRTSNIGLRGIAQTTVDTSTPYAVIGTDYWTDGSVYTKALCTELGLTYPDDNKIEVTLFANLNTLLATEWNDLVNLGG